MSTFSRGRRCFIVAKLLFQTILNYLCPHLHSLQGAREESLHLLRRFYKVRAHRNYTLLCPSWENNYMSLVYPHAFYWVWASTFTRSRYRARYQYWVYQKMVVCDTTVKHRVTSCLDKHSTNLTAPITKRQEKIKVAREWFILGFRLYRICQYLAFYAFFFFHQSNQWRHYRFPRCSCCIERGWLVSSLLQSFTGRHACLLVSKLLAHDSIFKLFSPSHIDKLKHKLQKDIYTHT